LVHNPRRETLLLVSFDVFHTCKPRILSNCSSKLCQALYRVPLLVLVVSTPGGLATWSPGSTGGVSQKTLEQIKRFGTSRPFNSHVEHRLPVGLRDARSQGNRRDADIPRLVLSVVLAFRLLLMPRIANLLSCLFL